MHKIVVFYQCSASLDYKLGSGTRAIRDRIGEENFILFNYCFRKKALYSRRGKKMHKVGKNRKKNLDPAVGF